MPVMDMQAGERFDVSYYHVRKGSTSCFLPFFGAIGNYYSATISTARPRLQ